MHSFREATELLVYREEECGDACVLRKSSRLGSWGYALF